MNAPIVTTLYRYPVKSFTPERRYELNVLESGRIEGDRVLAIQLGDAGDPPREAQKTGEGWWPKERFITLMTTPGLARLTLRYNDQEQRLRIDHGSRTLVDVELDDDGRQEIAAVVEAFVRRLGEGPDLDRPGRRPLQVIGDGALSRFQDYPAGYVTLQTRASLQALGEALDDDALDERRFRSNVIIDGTEPWEELRWVGRTLRIGDLAFEVTRPVVRCLATHANPVEGVRDREVLKTLPDLNGLDDPCFAVALTPASAGTIRVGDSVTVE